MTKKGIYSDSVGCKFYTGILWVAVIQYNPTKNVTYWVKWGHCGITIIRDGFCGRLFGAVSTCYHEVIFINNTSQTIMWGIFYFGVHPGTQLVPPWTKCWSLSHHLGYSGRISTIKNTMDSGVGLRTLPVYDTGSGVYTESDLTKRIYNTILRN